MKLFRRPHVTRLDEWEIVAEGVRRRFLHDLSHSCMTASWPAFIAGAAMVFLLFNAMFATLYWFGRDPIANASGQAFIEYFYFSIETLSTAGYGDMHPQTHYGHFIATVELFTGIFSMSLMTGLIFARFSRPRARFLFADRPVVAQHNGKPTLMIRFANERHNAITHAVARLWAVTLQTTPNGGRYLGFVELPLERRDNPILALTWTVLHVIDENSPLYHSARTEQDLDETRLVLLVSGFDEKAGQEIHARKTYRPGDILHGRYYVDIVSPTESGVRVDYRRFHDTRPIRPE